MSTLTVLPCPVPSNQQHECRYFDQGPAESTHKRPRGDGREPYERALLGIEESVIALDGGSEAMLATHLTCVAPSMVVDASHRTEIAMLTAKHGSCAKEPNLVKILRTMLPALKMYGRVYYEYTRHYWVVDTRTFNKSAPAALPLRIGGSPVYLTEGIPVIGIPFLPDAFHIPTIGIAWDEEILKLANTFPHAIGVRVLRWGHVVVLFENWKQLRKQEQMHFPGSICGMTFSFAIASCTPSTAPIENSTAVTAIENSINTRGVVGVRLRLPGETEDCWTTTTHAWVEFPNSITSFKTVKNLCANMMSWMRKSGLGSILDFYQLAINWGKASAQDPTGTEVYVAGSKTKIGTIVQCYDSLPLPDSRFMFPMGYSHDLSLIKGPFLPAMATPAGLPSLDRQFATLEEISNAETCFVSYFNFYFGRRDLIRGHPISTPAREALLSGVEYWWDRFRESVHPAIIWRTELDDKSLVGASGSPVCLGSPSDSSAKVAVFQNYETHIGKGLWYKFDRNHEQLTGCVETCSYDAGFLLPLEVQQATITVPKFVKRRSVSSPSYGQLSSGISRAGERREFSGHV